MRKDKYLVYGATQMINIDFAFVYPQVPYFISCNFMFEFTDVGQIISSRADILPYKLGCFSPYNIGINTVVDLLKFMLVIYTAICVQINFKRANYKINLNTITENLTDITIVFLQTYNFLIKIQDSIYFNVDPMKYLSSDTRYFHTSLNFIARNFRDFCTLDTIALLFVFSKVADGFRLV